MEELEARTGFRRILLPVDGLASNEEVLTRAELLLKRPDVTATLLTVIETSGPRTNTPEFRADPRHQEVFNRLDGMRRTLAERGIVAETQIRFGHPAKEIVREAEITGHDLIVMATRGRTELGRLFLGSVAQGVLHFTRVPVLLFREPARPEDRAEAPEGLRPALFRRIFVPLEGTKLSEQSLPHAMALARDFGSELCLSTVIPSPPIARARRKASRYIDSLLVEMEGRGLKVTGEVLCGAPGALTARAADRGFDTIAMATRGRTALGSAFWGSETAQVVSETTLPVLVVRGLRGRELSRPGSRAGAASR